ncbi:MAG TPA: DUF4304 domain-containing protein [Candidatus Paceibacterota bacterium]|nr:DUF4304 domain-containing protein [Candidatus Paceibacterota bacterium]
MDSKTRFLNVLKQEFAPHVRQEGFKGSGQNFYRVSSDLINVINVQASKWGDSYAVNLGLHPLGMPTEGTASEPEAKHLKEYECLFRTRLSKPTETDRWWKHNGIFTSPERSARSLIDCYKRYGSRYFLMYQSAAQLLQAFDCDEMGRKDNVVIAGQTMVKGRAALVGAWLAEHLHDYARARELADFAEANKWDKWPFAGEVARLRQLT